MEAYLPLTFLCAPPPEPLLGIKGGDKRHPIPVFFTKMAYLNSAYKVLQRGPKKPAP